MKVLHVATRAEHTCAVLEDHRVACWGGGMYGDLGDGIANKVGRPSHVVTVPKIVPGITTAVRVAVGLYHSCAILEDKTAACWGAGNEAQLGDQQCGDDHVALSPTPVLDLDGVVDISTAIYGSCAVLETGKVACWGRAAYFQLAPDPEICTFTCLDENGQSSECAYEVHVIPKNITGIDGAVQVVATDDHACALLAGGTVKCWGSGAEGALGDGNTSPHEAPAPIEVSGLVGARQIAADGYLTFVRTDGGQVLGWGYNLTHVPVLVDPVVDPVGSPTLIAGLEGVASVGTTTSSTFAILNSGQVAYWAEPGLDVPGTTERQLLPDLSSVVDGSISAAMCFRRADDVLLCAGDNSVGGLGDGTTISRSSFAPVLAPVE